MGFIFGLFVLFFVERLIIVLIDYCFGELQFRFIQLFFVNLMNVKWKIFDNDVKIVDKLFMYFWYEI